MDCRNCGGSLSVYRLAGKTAAVCDGCGRVGIEVDHSGSPLEEESWNAAFRRFYRRQSSAVGASSSAGVDDES